MQRDRLAALLPTADRAIGDPEQAVKLSTDLCAPIVAVQPLSGCYEFPPNHASRRAARLVERPLRHQPPSKRRQTSPSYLVGRIARGISGTPCHLNLPAAPHAHKASCAIPHRAEAALRTAKVPNRPYVLTPPDKAGRTYHGLRASDADEDITVSSRQVLPMVVSSAPWPLISPSWAP